MSAAMRPHEEPRIVDDWDDAGEPATWKETILFWAAVMVGMGVWCIAVASFL